MNRFRILFLVGCAMLCSVTLEGKTITLAGRQTESVLELNTGNTYAVTSQYIIPSGCILKIPEGVSIVFEKDVGISVDGTLMASGTVSKPVRFVGKQTRPGFWSGFVLARGSKVDLYGAIVADAKIGLKAGFVGGLGTFARCCSFVNNEEGVFLWDSWGSMEGCLVAKNEKNGINLHYQTSTFSHCTITENQGCGIVGWGNARLTSCVVSKNLSHGISCSDSKCFATGCIFGDNREFDVKNDTGSVWDFGNNYWGEAATKLLKAKGIAANLPKVNDKLDGHGDGIVDLTGFLLKPPKECGATEYPGAKVRMKKPETDEQSVPEVAEKEDSAEQDASDEENNNGDAEEEDSQTVDSDIESDDGVSADNAECDDNADTQTDIEEPMFVKPTEVPNDVAVAKAVKVMVEICGDDLKAVNAGKMTQAEFASKLLSYVRKTDSIPVKFVLLRNAFKRLLMAKSVVTAHRLFDKVEAKYGVRFAIAMTKTSDANLKALLKNAKTADAGQVLISKIDELSACIRKICAADNALRKKPDSIKIMMDKAANCVKIGDWQSAFKIYAKMDNECGKVVRWELKNPNERSKDYTAEKVGDYWWSVIGEAKEDCALFRSVSRHAAYWYRQALKDGGMSEMKVELVKKRIARTKVSASLPMTKEKSVVMPKQKEEEMNNEVSNNAMKEGKSKDVVLVPTSDIEQTEWKYCTQAPSGAWTQLKFDDNDWFDGASTFWHDCSRGTQGTVWSARDIYLRKVFDCAYNPSAVTTGVLKYCIDDNIEIWLNGVKIFDRGLTRQYEEIKPMKAIVMNLKKGRNVLAVHAYNRGGAGYVDVGISIKIK